METTINVICPDYLELDTVKGKEFSLPDFEEIKLICTKTRLGYIIFEVKTGLPINQLHILYTTKKSAIKAAYDKFKEVGKEEILQLINLKINKL